MGRITLRAALVPLSDALDPDPLDRICAGGVELQLLEGRWR